MSQFNFERFTPMPQEHLKDFVRHVGSPSQLGIPVVAKEHWPDFPESQKPSTQSPYRTVLWFHREINNGVRILIEGREKAAVDAYAKAVMVDRSNVEHEPTRRTDP